jgi:hypothetical protein
MRGLDPSAADKLVKVCGLLASDHDGERAAAARQAVKMLQAAGLTWGDIIRPAQPVPPPLQCSPPPTGHVAQAWWAQRFPDSLTQWERKFLADIARRHSLSPKQASSLSSILRRLQAEDAA